MTDLAGKFNALETQLTTQHGEVTTALAGLQSSLDILATALEIANENGAANTRYILAALAQIDPCKDCGTPPSLIVPVPGTVPATINTVHCARMQALLALIRETLVKLDVMSLFSVGFSYSTVTALFSELASGGLYPLGLPAPSYVEISTLIGSGLAFLASNIVRGDRLQDLFDSQYNALLSALYASGDATAGLAAYTAVIEASGLPADERGELEAVAFVEWFNWYFDVSNEVDTTGINGSLCAISTCTTYTTTDYGSHWVIDWTPDAPTYRLMGDWYGYTIQLLTAPYDPPAGAGLIKLYMYETESYPDPAFIPQLSPGYSPTAIGYHTVFLECNEFKNATAGQSFSIEICPPAE